MDYLKELSKQLGGKIQKQNHFDGNDGHSNRALVIKNYKDYHFRIEEFGNRFKIGVKVECDFSFSINNPDKIFVYTKPVIIKNFPYKLYFSHTVDDPLQNISFKKFWDIASFKIKSMILSTSESIFIYGNWVQFSLNSDRKILSDIDNIVSLVSSGNIFKKSVKKEKIVTENIPDNLIPLIPLLKKWSIADDNEREQLIEETSKKQMEKLIYTVDPYMKEINEFLNSFGNKPLNNEAILLGNLAELVSELKIE